MASAIFRRLQSGRRFLRDTSLRWRISTVGTPGCARFRIARSLVYVGSKGCQVARLPGCRCKKKRRDKMDLTMRCSRPCPANTPRVLKATK